jgi:hypothetical protein
MKPPLLKDVDKERVERLVSKIQTWMGNYQTCVSVISGIVEL